MTCKKSATILYQKDTFNGTKKCYINKRIDDLKELLVSTKMSYLKYVV